jgi:hypothetical protein
MVCNSSKVDRQDDLADDQAATDKGRAKHIAERLRVSVFSTTPQ